MFPPSIVQRILAAVRSLSSLRVNPGMVMRIRVCSVFLSKKSECCSGNDR